MSSGRESGWARWMALESLHDKSTRAPMTKAQENWVREGLMSERQAREWLGEVYSSRLANLNQSP